MKRTIVIKMISLSLVAVMICVCFASCALADKAKSAFNGLVDDVEGAMGEQNNPLALNMQNSPQISLCAAVLPPVYEDGAAGGAVLSTTLTATILPETVSDEFKKVDWGVYWITNNTGDANANVSDYLTATTTVDGGCAVVVKVYKSFEGSIIGIKATTRRGGHEAVCEATYEGKPTALKIYRMNGSNTTLVGTTLTLDAGTSYQFELVPDNHLGQVGSKCNTFEVVSIEESGTVTGMMSDRGTNSGTPFETTYNIGDSSCPLPAFAGVSITDGIMTVTASSLVNHRFTANNAYGYYTSGIENCSFKVTVKETLTGVTNVLNFTIRSVDEAVAIDNSNLVF